MCGARFTLGVAVLAQRFVLGSHPALRFCCGDLSSVHACCLTHCAKQDGLRYLAFLFRRVEIAIRAFSRCRCGYLPLWVHFGFGRLFVAISTGYRSTGERGNGRTGLRGWRRGLCALLRKHIGFAILSAGSTLGLRAPNLRQRVFDSLDSLHAAAGLCWYKYPSLQKAQAPQSAHPRLQNPGTRKDPPGSDLWPVRSGCIAMLPARSIVQTRAAPKRRRVGLRAR